MLSSERGAVPAQPFYLSWKVAFWAVLLLALILYIPTLGNGPVWDDFQILSGEAVGGSTISGAITKPFLKGYFRPLVSIVLQLENAAFQGQTFYYHLVNVALHLAGCAAAMGLILASFRSRRIAFIGGLATATHPVMTSTVSWIGGLTDVLATFLVGTFLLGLIQGLQGAPSSRSRWLALSVGSFAAALFCKEQTITLLAMVPAALLAFGPRSTRRSWGAHVRLILPYGIATLVFLAAWANFFPEYPEVVRTASERVQAVGQSLLYYSMLLVAPLPRWLQTYSLNAFAGQPWLWAAVGFGVLGAWLGSLWVLWRTNPKLAWFGLLALLVLLPVSNILPPPSLVVAPYRAGVAVLGLSGVAGYLLARLLRVQAAAVLAPVAILYWLVVSLSALPAWIDNLTLFRTIVRADPHFLLAKRNLARSLLRTQGDPAANSREAVAVLESALDDIYGQAGWRQGGEDVLSPMTDAGPVARLNRNKGPMKPATWLSELYTQLGEARAVSGDLEGSQSAFRSALLVRPSNFTATMALAQIAAQRGDLAEARRWLEAAQQLRPGDPSIAQMLRSLPK